MYFLQFLLLLVNASLLPLAGVAGYSWVGLPLAALLLYLQGGALMRLGRDYFYDLEGHLHSLKFWYETWFLQAFLAIEFAVFAHYAMATALTASLFCQLALALRCPFHTANTAPA